MHASFSIADERAYNGFLWVSLIGHGGCEGSCDSRIRLVMMIDAADMKEKRALGY